MASGAGSEKMKHAEPLESSVGNESSGPGPTLPLSSVPQGGTAVQPKAERSLLIVFLLVTFLIILLRNAWMCDDAYITLRTVHHFTHGLGLRYNIFERVQTYTHPLWMLLLALGYFVTHEAYYTTIAISVMASFVAVALLAFRLAQSVQGAVLAVTVLAFSKAFIDYTTSGLEYPLSYLLLVLFWMSCFRAKDAGKPFVVSFLGSLCVLNRMDILLMVLPALLFVFWRQRSLRATLEMVLGFLPFLLWEIFSFVYYGFLFPNTAYAKLAAGISKNELFGQGLFYVLNSMSWDPVTLLIIASGLVLPVVHRRWDLLPIMLGIVLYLVYTVKIGGDFMSGRFFALPLLGAVAILSRLSLSTPFALAAGVVVIGMSVSSPMCPILSGVSYGKTDNIRSLSDKAEITDERAYYYPNTGLLGAHRLRVKVEPPKEDRNDAITTPTKVLVELAIGHYGFSQSAYVHLIDSVALADPLLARLPAQKTPGWRIGHFHRRIPDGYLETLASGKNRIKDKSVAAYYDKLSYVIRGPVWDWTRLVTAMKMNLGFYDDLIDRRFYRRGTRSTVALGEISVPKEEGTMWDAPGNLILDDEVGLTVLMGKAEAFETIELSLDHNDEYEVAFLRGNQELGSTVLKGSPAGAGLAIFRVQAPRQAVQQGYDRIRIKPISGDKKYSLGHLRVIP